MNQDAGDLEQVAYRLVADGSGPGRTLGRVFQTLRYYRWTQIARRAAGNVKRRLPGQRLIGTIDVPSDVRLANDLRRARQIALAVLPDYRHHISHSRGNLEAGCLVLLNHKEDLGSPPEWKGVSPQLPRLWRFHLHYHEYLLSFVADRGLAENPGDPAWGTVWQVLASWIDAHPPEAESADGDAWHPYCISRRLQVWMWVLAMGDPPPAVRQRIVESAYRQACFLARNLELDVRGNHLVENLAALVVAGCCIAGGEPWVNAAAQHLDRELAVQILEHGEHFERAPMYHCQVLGQLLRISYLAADRWAHIARHCGETARRMLEFLAAIRLPHGSIPLLGDSVNGEAPTSQQIDRLAALNGMQLARAAAGVTEAGPYWVWRSAEGDAADFLLLDRGEVGAADLPAHAHCDLLNLIAWVAGRPWFIDSGNFDYGAGSMRQYCRSSLAHNVATVDGRNSCDIWSRFRMGWRGRITGMSSGSGKSLVRAVASHDGYRRAGVPQIHRVVAVEPATGTWICADMVQTPASGRLRGYLHIDPGVNIAIDREEPGAAAFHLDDGNSRRRLVFFGTSDVRIQEGWHCPAFGVRQRHRVLVYDQSGTPGFGWILYRPELEYPEAVIDASGFRVRTAHDEFVWRFPGS